MPRKLTDEQKQARDAKRKREAAEKRDKKKKETADRREAKKKAAAAEKEAKKKAEAAAKEVARLEAKEEAARKKSEAAQKRADAKAAADNRKAEEQRKKAEEAAALNDKAQALHAKLVETLNKARERKRAVNRGEEVAPSPSKRRVVPVIGREGGVKTAVRLKRNPDKGYKRRAYVSNRGILDDGDNRVAYPGENKKHPRDVYVSDRGNFFKVYGEQGE